MHRKLTKMGMVLRGVAVVILTVGGGDAARAGSNSGGMTPVKMAVPKRLELGRAVQIALKQNPDILRAEQEIERTQGLVIEIGAEALPQIGVNSTYNQQSSTLVNGPTVPGTVIPNPSGIFTPEQARVIQALQQSTGQSGQSRGAQTRDWNVQFQVQQLIYSGGRVFSALKVARFQKNAALYTLRDTVDTVIARVRTQYYQVQFNRVLITVQKENLAQAKADLKDQQDRFEAGTVPRYNVLRAEVEVANVLPQLVQAQNNYKIAQLQLAKTLGLDYQGELASEDTIETVGELEIPPYDTGIEAAVTLGRTRRASLKAQRENILTQAENIRVQLAGYQPTLSVNAGYQYENSPFTRNLSDTVDGWFFGITGSWNIFDGGATYGRVKQARAQLEEARVAYVDAVRQVDLEVQDAFSSLTQARQLLESQRKNIETAEEALRLAQERFRAGAGTQLDILDARVALVQARTNEVQARYNYNVALAELQRATATDTRYDDTFSDPLTRMHVQDPTVPEKLMAPPKRGKTYTTDPASSPARK